MRKDWIALAASLVTAPVAIWWGIFLFATINPAPQNGEQTAWQVLQACAALSVLVVAFFCVVFAVVAATTKDTWKPRKKKEDA